MTEYKQKNPYVNNFLEKQEFIERATRLLESTILENERIKKKQNRDKYRNLSNEKKRKLQESKKRYSKSENGVVSTLKKRLKRRKMEIDSRLNITSDQRKMISEFYINCPEGYHVDHIIPISKGGKHRISNLQYLSARENCEKSNRIEFLDDADKVKYYNLLDRIDIFSQHNIKYIIRRDSITLSDITAKIINTYEFS